MWNGGINVSKLEKSDEFDWNEALFPGRIQDCINPRRIGARKDNPQQARPY